jgi:putative ABC transport system permease protein
MILTLASKSLMNRKGSVLLTIVAMAVSLFVLLAVDHIRQQAKHSFASTVSGVDLIVGGRTSSINLLLYSVFRIGSPTANLSWASYEHLAKHPKIAWSIPISLGDSHKGYRVMGTTTDFFSHFKYGKKHPLTFANGKAFKGMFDVVLGAQVAKKLHYNVKTPLILAHGIAATSFAQHDQHPFNVVGILEPTGTPLDQTLIVSLQGIEAIHENWQTGTRLNNTASHSPKTDVLIPQSITAAMVGLTSRMATFGVQAYINQYKQEALTAILPGIALSELWQIMGSVEQILELISYLVLLASLLGLCAMLLASIRERQMEIQLLRIMGAPPWYIFMIVELEAMLMALVSGAISVVMLWAVLMVFQSALAAEFGLQVSLNLFSIKNLQILLLVLLATVIAAAIPSAMAYRSATHAVK